MSCAKLDAGRHFVVRAEHDTDLIKFVAAVATRNEIELGTFTAIGALKHGKLGFYDQETHEYIKIPLAAPYEIASCVGNISLKNNKPFVHAHAVLADQDGDTKAGHLLEAQVFAAEVHLVELIGRKLLRKKDAITGLALWDI